MKKKNLKDEIAVRGERHRREMLNLDKNLEGKSTKEAIELLDGIEERAHELIPCIDNRISELDNELGELDKELEEINKRDWVDIGLWVVVFGFYGVAAIYLIIGLISR